MATPDEFLTWLANCAQNHNEIYRQYYLVFSVSTLVFGWGAQYLPEAEGRGQIRHRGQIPGRILKMPGNVVFITYLDCIWHLSDFVCKKISPRQSRHTNPGGLHVMTGELSELMNMTIVLLIHFVDKEWYIVYINKYHCNLTKYMRLNMTSQCNSRS